MAAYIPDKNVAFVKNTITTIQQVFNAPGCIWDFHSHCLSSVCKTWSEKYLENGDQVESEYGEGRPLDGHHQHEKEDHGLVESPVSDQLQDPSQLAAESSLRHEIIFGVTFTLRTIIRIRIWPSNNKDFSYLSSHRHWSH